MGHPHWMGHPHGGRASMRVCGVGQLPDGDGDSHMAKRLGRGLTQGLGCCATISVES